MSHFGVGASQGGGQRGFARPTWKMAAGALRISDARRRSPRVAATRHCGRHIGCGASAPYPSQSTELWKAATFGQKPKTSEFFSSGGCKCFWYQDTCRHETSNSVFRATARHAAGTGTIRCDDFRSAAGIMGSRDTTATHVDRSPIAAFVLDIRRLAAMRAGIVALAGEISTSRKLSGSCGQIEKICVSSASKCLPGRWINWIRYEMMGQ